MKIRIIIIATVLAGLSVVQPGCADQPDGLSDDENEHQYSDSDADSDTDADADTDSDADGDWEGDNPPNTGDQYDAVGTNPFVYTSHDPFSTFAADVDTASYDIFRRDIEDGYLPMADSVRLEEYMNYFSYEYPPPGPIAEHPFSISVTAAPGLAGYDTTLLRVGIQGKVIPESAKPQANLVFLVDTSGSMGSGDKLGFVKHLLNSSLEYLDPDDTISIVTYAGATGVALAPTPVSDAAVIANAINSFTAGGSTAGAAGIDLAYQQAEAGFIEDGVNHVLLCTDGDFNVGASSTDALVDLIEEKRETGITLTVLGFGTGNLNDAMMEAISNAGNGTYSVISSLNQAEKYAQHGLLNGLFYIAKDVKLQVEFNPEQVLAYRLLGYENRELADDDFIDDTVDGGEIGSGHRVTAFYELILPGQEVPQPEDAPDPLSGEPVEGEQEISAEDMVLVKVRYKDVDATALDEAYATSVSMGSEDILESTLDADQDFQWAASIAAFAEILKESPFADESALTDIHSTLLSYDTPDEDRIEFIDLFETSLTYL